MIETHFINVLIYSLRGEGASGPPPSTPCVSTVFPLLQWRLQRFCEADLWPGFGCGGDSLNHGQPASALRYVLRNLARLSAPATS